ncbi:MAG: hypothetical protein ACPL1K_01525 [Candidatus Kryptoniota bacterium]
MRLYLIDGIPNDYEALHGLDLQVNDAMGDLDGDLVPTLWEYELRDRGKSPDNPYDTYGFEIIVSFEWDINVTFRDAFIQTLRDASSYLFAVTDGYFFIGRAELCDNKEMWDEPGSIRVRNGDGLYWMDEYWQHSDIGISGHVYVPRAYDAQGAGGPVNTYPSDNAYSRMLAHEICHARFNLGDEYIRGDGSKIDDSHYLLHTIMGSGNPKLSTRYDYENPYDEEDGYTHIIDTRQKAINGESCGETVFRYYNYFTSTVRGVQFNLNSDLHIDKIYPITYVQDESIFLKSSEYPNPEMWRYRVGYFASIIIIM